jgi:hypothetical protein
LNSTEQRFYCVHLRVDDVGILEDSADIAGEIADALRDASFEPESISELSFLRSSADQTTTTA